jgi:DNA-binding beta-propeller fold protein YncE
VPGDRAAHRAQASSDSPGAAKPETSPSRVRPQALVTAETEDRLIAVDPRTGRVEKSVPVASDPQFVATTRSVAVVVSPGAGAVTLLSRPDLRQLRVIPGFDSPHIAEIAPGGRFAYVTDDASGKLTVIRLSDGAVVDRLTVGAGAHHLAFRPDGGEAWIALGESARTIVVLDTSRLARPRVIGRFDPGYPAHDLTFAPDGRRVWVTSSDSPEVGVFSAASRRLASRVAGGKAPQHVVFADGRAYVTSGYGRRIEAVDSRNGRVSKVAHTPYGSFDLAADRRYIAVASLLRGTLALYSPALRNLRTIRLAPATRDVALSAPPARSR